MTAVRTYDKWLLVATLALVCFGALMIYSSTSVVTPAMEKRSITQFHYFKKHLFTVALGLAAMVFTFRLRPESLEKAAIPLLIISFILLVLVFAPGLGVKAGGARRWLRLWPSTFQPSELVKLSMVFFVAKYVSNRGNRIEKFAAFLVPVAVMAVFQAVMLKQPDFGAAMTLGVITLGMLFAAGARLRHLAYLLVLASPVVVELLRAPYRLKRLTTFLDPWSDPTESGFQLVQSFIAFGSGGITGVGLGNGRQKLSYLPEVHTDFIFSMVGEELGFLAAVFIVGVFAFIFLRGLSIAARHGKGFPYQLALGLSMMLGFQSIVNFSVVTGLLPTKGLPLPFVSYGGSSLLVSMSAVGILLNLSRSGSEVAAPPKKRETIEEMMLRKRARMAVYGERQ